MKEGQFFVCAKGWLAGQVQQEDKRDKEIIVIGGKVFEVISLVGKENRERKVMAWEVRD